ncbi:MAG: type II toxin-antitoxin system mRNA interferase toxin, RelE/StbE family [Deltaproteobacteria bacterium]|nr:type II toxin-antitoxin system mRNA interferase toxin, RelE/StbE family [Deltaproteobacteria bacterium]
MITQVALSRQVEKDLERVPAHIKVKLLSWVEAVENDGLEKVRKIPSYHDEPLKGSRIGQRSIRLSLSYRAIYEVRSEGPPRIIEIQEVTKHDY